MQDLLALGKRQAASPVKGGIAHVPGLLRSKYTQEEEHEQGCSLEETAHENDIAL